MFGRKKEVPKPPKKEEPWNDYLVLDDDCHIFIPVELRDKLGWAKGDTIAIRIDSHCSAVGANEYPKLEIKPFPTIVYRAPGKGYVPHEISMSKAEVVKKLREMLENLRVHIFGDSHKPESCKPYIDLEDLQPIIDLATHPARKEA